MRDWRDELEELVARGRASQGDVKVHDTLRDILRTLTADTSGPDPLTPSIAVLGLQSCLAGWIGVALWPEGHATLHLGATLVGVVEQVREQGALGALGISTITPKADELDAWRRAHPSVRIIDVDPEPAFTRLAHGREQGDRRQVLSAAGVTVPPMYPGMGFDESELMSACVVARTVAEPFC